MRLWVPSPTEPRAQGSRLKALGNSLQPKTGQATLEYALFIGVVAAALVGMTVYIRRSIQANLKMLEGQINAEAIQ